MSHSIKNNFTSLTQFKTSATKPVGYAAALNSFVEGTIIADQKNRFWRSVIQLIKQRPSVLLIICLASLALTGCRGINTFNPARLYIHNAERAKLSQEARDSFNKYREGSLNVYDQMESNLGTSDKIWTDSTHIAMDLQTDVFLQAIPLYTWEQFLSPTYLSPKDEKSVHKQLLTKIKTQNTENENRLKETVEKLGISKETLEDRNKAIAALKTKLKNQEDENKKYEENIEKFRKAIIKLAENGKNTSGDDLIKSILAAQKLDWDPSKGPGFKTTLISLAIDLAEAERDRTSTEIDFLQKVIKNGEKQKSIFSEAKVNLLDPAADDYEDFPEFLKESFSEDQKIANTIIKVLDQYHAAADADARLIQYSNVQAILEVIGNMAVVDNIYIPELEELEQGLASLEHSRSIQLSKINARAREAIISRGLESLAIYHAGGIKPEEIARFIYAASIVAAVLGAD